MPFLDSAKLFLYKKSLYSFLAFAVVVSVFCGTVMYFCYILVLLAVKLLARDCKTSEPVLF